MLYSLRPPFFVLIGHMIFLLRFLKVIRISISIDSFLAQLNCGILYLYNLFWPIIKKSRVICTWYTCVLPNLSYMLFIFLFSFSCDFMPCSGFASCVDRILISYKKKIINWAWFINTIFIEKGHCKINNILLWKLLNLSLLKEY